MPESVVHANSRGGAAPLQGHYGVASRRNKNVQPPSRVRPAPQPPDYRLLARPRTNNYYSATGGCPCVPRAAAHPGSWRLKFAQLRSVDVPRGAQSKKAHVGHSCCVPRGDMYGWRPGPHRVLAKNTAASGLCDTFGNMAFKRKTSVEGGDSDVSSVNQRKLDDLESLILHEYDERRNIEMDVDELKEIQLQGTQDAYKLDYENEWKRRMASAASEDQLQDLLREVRDIVKRPLNQTNMDILRRIVEHQEKLIELRALKANEDYPQIIYP